MQRSQHTSTPSGSAWPHTRRAATCSTSSTLRIIEARQGEELGALIARSKGRWGTPMTAVVNALSADQLLGAGQLVKLAIAEPYLRAAR